MIAVNLSSVFRLCRAAGKHMLARGGGGKIVNIASLLSFQGGITVPGYAAAKGGVTQLTKALANEWAAHGINVNAIAPGYMETDNTAALRADPQRNAQITERIPAGRWGTPEDLAGAVVFLASKRVRLRARPRARRGRRLDGPLRHMTTTTAHASAPRRPGSSCSRLFARLVGPAALTAAGMIGAGAVATRLLAGAWFGFDLLWVALPSCRWWSSRSTPRRASASCRGAAAWSTWCAPTSARGWPGPSSCRRRS